MSTNHLKLFIKTYLTPSLSKPLENVHLPLLLFLVFILHPTSSTSSYYCCFHAVVLCVVKLPFIWHPCQAFIEYKLPSLNKLFSPVVNSDACGGVQLNKEIPLRPTFTHTNSFALGMIKKKPKNEGSKRDGNGLYYIRRVLIAMNDVGISIKLTGF